ncbi:MAG: MFS transporter [Oscillospiraceae bacterium]|nr:MFS transporter [Oscillospiraceae bacterium]
MTDKNSGAAGKAMRGVRIFIVVSALVGLAMGLSDAILANYFKEAYEVTPGQRGFIEFPRELPGILSLFAIAALSSLKNVKTAILTQGLALAGLVVLGVWRPSFAVMCVFLFIYSLGQHMYMPLNDSIGLSLAKARGGAGTGRMMGRFHSARMAATVLAGVLVFFGFRGGWFDFNTPVIVFLIAAAAFLLVGVFLGVLRKADPVVETDAPVNAKFVFRKEYLRYYVICALFGGRKQIMIVYSPWVLIELLGFRADTMSVLAVTGALIGVFFLPMIGKWIDRFGVRRIMMVESFAFILIYIAYGLLSRWLGGEGAAAGGLLLLLVYLLNILDRMTGQFSMDRAIYMRQIALAPEDVTPSLSLGMGIDHVLAIAGATVCGVIWQSFGPEYVFVLAGGLALLNFFVAKGIKLNDTKGDLP